MGIWAILIDTDADTDKAGAEADESAGEGADAGPGGDVPPPTLVPPPPPLTWPSLNIPEACSADAGPAAE